MNRGITKKPFKTIVYVACGIYLLQFNSISHAVFTAETIKTIQGDKPRLSSNIENHLDDFELFGLKYDNKSYYGNDLIDMPVPVSYPFKNRFTVAPIKRPDGDQYLDVDGDELGSINIKNRATMTWYYTNSAGVLTEFNPKDTDTFCGLADKGLTGPFKVRISADITLLSKYGDPYANEYPNDEVITHPTKLFTVLENVGVCYARPSLLPSEAKNSNLNHWDKSRGFLIQSNVDASKNFPTTAFYGARFDLVMAKGVKVSDYDWSIAEGRELVNLNTNASGNVVNIAFTTASALNTRTSWEYVAGQDGYKVTIQGKNKQTGNKIQYAFVVQKWFSGWDKNVNGRPKASYGREKEIEAGCQSLDGKYRISYAPEVSNAPFGNRSGTAPFTREIGKLLGEWGDPDKNSYPNSWMAESHQANIYKRIWLWDPEVNKHCDLHSYNAKYHCRSEAEKKNGVCTAIK